MTLRRLSLPMLALAWICGPSRAEGYDWGGVHVGMHLTAAESVHETSLHITNDLASGYFAPLGIAGVEDSGSPSLGDSGFAAGGQLGWSRQTDNLVWGFEVDFDWLGLDDKDDFEIAADHGGQFFYTTSGNPYELKVQHEVDWQSTIRARLGWAMGPWLAYATGGLALADVEFEQEFSELALNPGNVMRAHDDEVQVGWAAGAGAEFGFAEHWSARVDYLYSRFELRDVEGRYSDAGSAANFENDRDDLQLHLLRFGLNFRFW